MKKTKIIDDIITFDKIYIKDNSPGYLKTSFISYITAMISFVFMVELMYSVLGPSGNGGTFEFIIFIGVFVLMYDVLIILYYISHLFCHI